MAVIFLLLMTEGADSSKFVFLPTSQTSMSFWRGSGTSTRKVRSSEAPPPSPLPSLSTPDLRLPSISSFDAPYGVLSTPYVCRNEYSN